MAFLKHIVVVAVLVVAPSVFACADSILDAGRDWKGSPIDSYIEALGPGAQAIVVNRQALGARDRILFSRGQTPTADFLDVWSTQGLWPNEVVQATSEGERVWFRVGPDEWGQWQGSDVEKAVSIVAARSGHRMAADPESVQVTKTHLLRGVLFFQARVRPQAP